eukprot:CAMPEP_0197443684 /NCGR_PEP_ID=MMETSP1175-20131217/9361_1 /TAXON_ID=1003142 /ORGANISM="Triceratium dubium, Strain CCMP147" /LENGTH=275 /DNA_ID=CAMNT_0042974351 /DNA_START=137 /DNA_END=964 /DNA_ORIENTATION=+
MEKSESFGGSQHSDRYGPVEYESSSSSPPIKERRDSDVHTAVLYDVPLEFEELPPRDFDNIPERGTGIHQLRRTARLARIVCLIAVTFLVVILVLVVPPKNIKAASSASSDHVPGGVSDEAEEQLVAPRPSCNERFVQCVGDRMSHGELLETGDALCSTDRHFEMGIDVNGSLVWQNCTSGEYVEFHHGEVGYSFKMDKNGDFLVMDENGGLKKEWECEEDMRATRQCFQTGSGRSYDCPFLHIHRKKGRVVLNWEDDEDGWHSKGIQRVFDGLY